MSTGFVAPRSEHALSAGAKLRGTAIRLAQLDALHHRLPSTAGSPAKPCRNGSPGAKLPRPSQVCAAMRASFSLGRCAAGSVVP